MNEEGYIQGNKTNILITGKYVDFKKEEWDIMKSRIAAINEAMTSKCVLLSLKQLEKNFCFDFVFCGMNLYLKKIEEYDKKQRKDDLKKWWMNQKASEMAKDCLPSILDRMDQISTTIAKQQKSELLRNKYEKYIKYELLECALKCSFRRPRSSSANVFPNTSFQYARSRLRKKLESEYFTESELQQFGLITTNKRKKKEEWIKVIEIKKCKYKEEYFNELNKRKQRMRKKKLNKNRYNISVSCSVSSSDLAIMDTIDDDDDDEEEGNNIPPPPPINYNDPNNDIPPILNMKMPRISSIRPNGYCSQCTSYAMEITKLIKELHSFKVSFGETQMALNNKIEEVNHWKKKYIESINDNDNDNDNDSNINYKEKYHELQSQIALLIGTNTNNNNNNNNKTRPRNNSQNSMSFQSEFSLNPGSDKMSVSNNSSLNRYNYNVVPTDSVIGGFPNIGINPMMNHIVESHLKHHSNSTEKMLEKIQQKHNKMNSKSNSKQSRSQSSYLSPEAEALLFPVTSSNNMNDTPSTQNTLNQYNNKSQSTFASSFNQPQQAPPPPHFQHRNSNPVPDYNHINNITLIRAHSSNQSINTKQIPTMTPFNEDQNQYFMQNINNNNNNAPPNHHYNNNYPQNMINVPFHQNNINNNNNFVQYNNNQ